MVSDSTLAMGKVEDGAAGGLVNAAGFHADKAVFDEIDTADAVLAAEFVEHAHDLQRGEAGVVIVVMLSRR